MFVKKLTSIHDLQRIGYERNPYSEGMNRDFIVRYIIGRSGEAISILEEFDIYTGRTINVLGHTYYDPPDWATII